MPHVAQFERITANSAHERSRKGRCDRSRQGLHELEKQHLPFALAATLTSLAKGGQGKVKGSVRDKFKLRNNFTKQGIRFKPAEKKSARIEADVHTYLENRQQARRTMAIGKRKAKTEPLTAACNSREPGISPCRLTICAGS